MISPGLIRIFLRVAIMEVWLRLGEGMALWIFLMPNKLVSVSIDQDISLVHPNLKSCQFQLFSNPIRRVREELRSFSVKGILCHVQFSTFENDPKQGYYGIQPSKKQ